MKTPARQTTARLRIGIDATCLGAKRGYARFLRELLPQLIERDATNEYLLFVDSDTVSEVEALGLPGAPRSRLVQPRTSTGQARAASARGRRSLLDLRRMGRAVARESLDVMYFPSVYSYFPVPRPTPVVVAIHDAIPERYGAIVFPTRRNRWLWNAKVALARRRASAIVTVSEWSRRALAETFGIAPERIHVTPEAPSPGFTPAAEPGPRCDWLRAHGLPEDAAYFVYVGGFNPHKNLPVLVRAFADVARSLAAREGADGLHLLLCGDYAGDLFHADVEALRACIARSGVRERVHLPGFVPDSDLRHLYSGALAVVLPALEEGFGLPAVEGAACGAPCVATRRSPLPDLLVGGGLFIEPEDVAGWHKALAQIAADPALRAELGEAARARANTLSWSASADATKRVLSSAAEGAA